MIGFTDEALKAFLQNAVGSKYAVTVADERYSREYLSATTDYATIPNGLTLWRGNDRETEWSSLPMQKYGFDNGRNNQGDFNQIAAVPTDVEYAITTWAREQSDSDDMIRSLQFSTRYKQVSVNATTVGPSIYQTAASKVNEMFPAGTHTQTFELTYCPLQPNTVQVLFGTTVVATDNGSGVLNFISGYSAYSGTVNYAGAAVSITTTDLGTEYQTPISIKATAVAESASIPFYVTQGKDTIRDWVFQEKTKKVLWYGASKKFTVTSLWAQSQIIKQALSIQIKFSLDGSIVETLTTTENSNVIDTTVSR